MYDSRQEVSTLLMSDASSLIEAAQQSSLAGYTLLKAIRKYLECDMYMGLEVHTEDTLNELDFCIEEFGDLIEVSSLIYQF